MRESKKRASAEHASDLSQKNRDLLEKCKMLKELSKVVKSKKYDDLSMISKQIRDIKHARHSSVGQSQESGMPDSLPIYFN